MIVHRNSRLFKAFSHTPQWLCSVYQVRVGNNTWDYFEITRPFWMYGSKL